MEVAGSNPVSPDFLLLPFLLVNIRFNTLMVPLFSSLLGFYRGNVLPSTFGFLNTFFPWTHFIALSVLFLNEILGFLFFRIKIWSPLRGSLSKFFFIPPTLLQGQKKNFLFFSLRCFQFGILFGFFVDAFKVGS